MTTQVSLNSLVLMIGPSGSGKSTLAAQKFLASEIVSSDALREELFGNFRYQGKSDVLWGEMHRRVRLKLELGQRVVVDATNLKFNDRKKFVEIGKELGVPIFYVVVNRDLNSKLETAGWRNEVDGLVQRHDQIFNSNLKEILKGDGVAKVIDTRREDFEVVKFPQSNNLFVNTQAWAYKGILGIGDIHGNLDAMQSALDYAKSNNLFVVSLGDVVDYGKDTIKTFELMVDIVRSGQGIMVWGNHEKKIAKWLEKTRLGTFNGKLSASNQITADVIQAMNEQQKKIFDVAWTFLELVSYQHWLVGNVMFTHGAATHKMWEIHDHRLMGIHGEYAFFGQVDRNVPLNIDGFPNRKLDWVNEIPQGKTVLVGHHIVDNTKVSQLNGQNGGTAFFVDTGSSKGGMLSAVELHWGNSNSSLTVDNLTKVKEVHF